MSIPGAICALLAEQGPLTSSAIYDALTDGGDPICKDRATARGVLGRMKRGGRVSVSDCGLHALPEAAPETEEPKAGPARQSAVPSVPSVPSVPDLDPSAAPDATWEEREWARTILGRVTAAPPRKRKRRVYLRSAPPGPFLPGFEAVCAASLSSTPTLWRRT